MLVPIHAFDYTWGGERHVALVNGRTGAIAGHFPSDPLAIAIALLVLVGVVGALALLALQVVRWLS